MNEYTICDAKDVVLWWKECWDTFAGAVIGENENDIVTDLQDYSRSMLEEKEVMSGNPKSILINMQPDLENEAFTLL